MSKDKIEQRRLTHRGRVFHFVSYEEQPANPARLQLAVPPSWFLMNAGKRWLAIPHRAGQDPAELDALLSGWLDEHVFAGESGAP
ncbi:MAG TPA: hypothetical protein VEI06_07185 [Gemmatimonadaceae bacterium]|nr:hypothetical protein [Gemmatimonadaceae bacterium]